jgi:hypothetical protein
VQHAVGGLGDRLGDRKLVHLFVIALLQIDDLALRGARDQDHRKAVHRGVRERVQTVQESRRGNGEADARFLREESGDGGCVTGVLLVTEREHAQAVGLGAAREVGDRNAGQGIEGVDAVELECLDDELEAVDRVRLLYGDLGFCGAHGGCLLRGNDMVKTRAVPRP